MQQLKTAGAQNRCAQNTPPPIARLSWRFFKKHMCSLMLHEAHELTLDLLQCTWSQPEPPVCLVMQPSNSDLHVCSLLESASFFKIACSSNMVKVACTSQLQQPKNTEMGLYVQLICGEQYFLAVYSRNHQVSMQLNHLVFCMFLQGSVKWSQLVLVFLRCSITCMDPDGDRTCRGFFILFLSFCELPGGKDLLWGWCH